MSHLDKLLGKHLLRIQLGSGGCQDHPSGGGGRDEPMVEYFKGIHKS